MGFFFDWSTGDIGFKFGDRFGLTGDSHLTTRISDHVNYDFKTHQVHMVSYFGDDDDDDDDDGYGYYDENWCWHSYNDEDECSDGECSDEED